MVTKWTHLCRGHPDQGCEIICAQKSLFCPVPVTILPDLTTTLPSDTIDHFLPVFIYYYRGIILCLFFYVPPPFCSEIEILSKDGPEGHPYFCHSVSPSGDSLHNCSSRLRPVIWQVQCGSIVLPFCLMCIHLSDHHQVELLHWEISLSWALHHHEPQQPRISFPSRL